MSRRVVFVILEDFPGSENRVRRQARALRDAGWEVRIYAPRGRETVRDWEGIRIDRSWMSWRKADRMRRRLWEYSIFPVIAGWWLLRQAVWWRPDVVHVATMPDWLVFSALPARWFVGSKIVLDLHELMPELLIARGGSGWLHRVLTWAERVSVRRADLVLTPTPGCRDVLAERTGVKAAVVLNGVDPTLYPIVEPSAALPADGPPIVGYHGTLARRFGVATVIGSVAILRDRGVKCRLEIYGGGDEEGQLKALSSAQGLQDVVRFHGTTAAADLPPVVRGFAVGVVPLVDEPFTRVAYSSKLFEYVASGVPVVCSDIISMRQLFTAQAVVFATADDPNAWADAIARLLADRVGAVRMAREAQAQLGAFLWPSLAPAYVSLIEGLCGASIDS